MQTVSEILLSEYNDRLPDYSNLENKVNAILEDNLRHRFKYVAIEHRIKSPESLVDKFHRKAAKYRSIDEMTDVLGFRIICYFADVVDEVAEVINDIFDVDVNNSVDKRDILDPSTFGYLSIHYICKLKPEDAQDKPELADIEFEIQIRTMLQHTWAEIEHDLGYKSELAVPREVKRDFARVASLLEIADGYFLNIKQRLGDYEEHVRESIRNDEADNMSINRVTLEEFIRSGKPMLDLNSDIAKITNARITEVSPDICIPMLKFIGVATIGDLKKLIANESERAVGLAVSILEDTEIDELISTVGIYYLCRARLVYGEYSEDEIYSFCALMDSNHDRVSKKAQRILNQRALLNGN